MKGSYQVAALLDQNRIALIGSQHVDIRSHVSDYGRANEDGLEFAGVRPLSKSGFRRELSYAAIDLAAIAVTLYRQIHKRQTLLGRVRDLRREENRTGAGPNDGPFAAELDEGLDHAFGGQQLEHGGAFATGNDEAVQIFEVGRGAGKHGLGAGTGYRPAVRFEIALQCQHPDSFQDRRASCRERV